MTATANIQPISEEVLPTYAEVKAPVIPAGDFYFKHRPDPSLPAEDPDDIELEEYASPT